VSPACLVVVENDISANLGRLLKATGQSMPQSRPILEINPEHPIVKRLKDETDEKRFTDWSHLLFDQALLSEGGQLEDPAGFVRRLNDLLLTVTLTR
jgi:molecular chaperone HtpG